MPRETKFVLGLLAAWLCLALSVTVSGTFEKASTAGVALTVWGLVAVILLVVWISPSGRDWLAETDVKWLLVPHLTRFVGVYFLVLGARGALAAGFSRPAGIGDIIIAGFAALLLLVPAMHRRRILFVWNIAGLIDIVFVVFAAFHFGLNDRAGMAPLRQLPLSLLPTFLVPIIIVSHILIFVWLRRADRLQPPSSRRMISSILKK
jgi:hypothetical protein